ncbi:unnamed protein product, partial [Ectocarpus sp. 13 AM-2016]
KHRTQRATRPSGHTPAEDRTSNIRSTAPAPLSCASPSRPHRVGEAHLLVSIDKFCAGRMYPYSFGPDYAIPKDGKVTESSRPFERDVHLPESPFSANDKNDTGDPSPRVGCSSSSSFASGAQGCLRYTAWPTAACNSTEDRYDSSDPLDFPPSSRSQGTLPTRLTDRNPKRAPVAAVETSEEETPLFQPGQQQSQQQRQPTLTQQRQQLTQQPQKQQSQHQRQQLPQR